MATSHASVLLCSVAACVGDVFELVWSEKVRNRKSDLLCLNSI